MNTALEVELKIGLRGEGILEAFVGRLGEPTRVLIQDNHYFVSGDGRHVRLRQEDGCWYWTQKQKVLSEMQPGVFSRLETEFPCEPGDAAAALASGLLCRHPFVDDLGPLTYLGCLRNTRHLLPWHGHTLELDRSIFPNGRVEWELELEAQGAPELSALVLELICGLGLAAEMRTEGKMNRFLQSIQQSGPTEN